MTTLMAPTAADYQAIFDAERVKEYPAVDAFEARMGFKIERAKLEGAARVLACPLKKSPPNWQHGRVIYAAVRGLISALYGADGFSLYRHVDIGTAKGFSALCARWAIDDSDVVGVVDTVDVLPQSERLRRNTVAEVDGLKTLAEIVAPWGEARQISFHETTGVDFMKRTKGRIHSAFVDGKHTGSVVAEEGRLLASRQQIGDVAIFDDLHLPDIDKAVRGLSDLYELEFLRVMPNRGYAVGVRRG